MPCSNRFSALNVENCQDLCHDYFDECQRDSDGKSQNFTWFKHNSQQHIGRKSTDGRYNGKCVQKGRKGSLGESFHDTDTQQNINNTACVDIKGDIIDSTQKLQHNKTFGYSVNSTYKGNSFRHSTSQYDGEGGDIHSTKGTHGDIQ